MSQAARDADARDADTRDRVMGAIFGCALGDALGLPAEGGDKRILAERYPDGIALPHRASVRDFPLNDWTDDTDSAVLIIRSIAAEAPSPARDFAARLVAWYNGGFPELGDVHGAGCGNMTWRVLRSPTFATDPFAAAAAAIGPKAGNGALMRTAPCAFEPDPAASARYFCLATHSDARCVASCVLQSVLIRDLARVPHGAPVPGDVLRRPLSAALDALAAAGRTELMGWAWKSGSLEALELGTRDGRGYTFRTLGCALYAFRALVAAGARRDAALFKRVVTEIAMEGGDADTNCAVAGAVLGAALGYSALPADWIAALPNRAWLAAEIDAWFASASPPTA